MGLFADGEKILKISLIDPVDFDRSNRVIVKKDSVSFALKTPIDAAYAGSFKPACHFDVGDTAGELEKDKGFPGKHSLLFTRLVCSLPASIAASTSSQNFKLTRVVLSTLIASGSLDISIVYIAYTKV